MNQMDIDSKTKPYFNIVILFRTRFDHSVFEKCRTANTDHFTKWGFDVPCKKQRDNSCARFELFHYERQCRDSFTFYFKIQNSIFVLNIKI